MFVWLGSLGLSLATSMKHCALQRSCTWHWAMGKVVPRGLEPRTLRLLAVRSNQLSYETSCIRSQLVLWRFISMLRTWPWTSASSRTWHNEGCRALWGQLRGFRGSLVCPIGPGIMRFMASSFLPFAGLPCVACGALACGSCAKATVGCFCLR